MSIKLDRTKTPPAGEIMPFNFPRFKRFVCDNGLKVLLAENSDLPMVNFELCFKASPHSEEKGLEGTASLIAEVLSEGTEKRNSEQIANDLEYHGIEYFAFNDWDGVHFYLITLAEYTRNAFEILSDFIQNPIFPETEIERIRKERIDNRKRVVDDIGTVVNEQFLRILYGDYRYGTPLRGTIESLQRIKRDHIIDFYNRYFSLDGAVLFVSGDINEKQLRQLIKEYFNKKMGSPEERNPIFGFNSGFRNRVRIVHKEGAQQTEIKIGHLGVKRGDPDHYKVTLLDQLLGGYFLSRLNLNLRQDKGYTYGINSKFNSRGDIGPFSITTAVQSEHTAEAIDEIIKEMELIRSEPVSDEELANAKGYYNGIFPIAFESAFQILMGLSNIESNGFNDDYYRTFKDKINEVTKEDILSAAKKYLHPDDLIIVVGGDRKVIEESISKKYDVEIYDLSGSEI